MTTVIDHVRPWLIPSSAFATTTQAQLGATPTSTGTGSAITHPAISRRRRENVPDQRRDELVLRSEAEHRVVAPLEPDGRGRIRRETATAHRAGVVGRVEEEMVGELQQPLVQRAVEQPGHLLDGLSAV